MASEEQGNMSCLSDAEGWEPKQFNALHTLLSITVSGPSFSLFFN